jgi:DNA-binding NarL/FixJ family response regulator
MAKVFIIDDDQEINQSIQKAISVNFTDTQIFAYQAVEKALENLREKPDYLVLDHFLDRINSIDSIPVFQEFLPNTKIIVVSAQDDIEAFESAHLHGVGEYIQKDEALLKNIINYLKKDMKVAHSRWYDPLAKIFTSEVTPKRNKSIYHLDNKLSTSYFTKSFLQFKPFNTVLMFKDANDFLKQVEKLNPDVAILEFNTEVKKKDIELVKNLRLMSPETNILIFSDQTNVRIASELLRSGASYYLIKTQRNLLKLKEIIE